MTGATYDGSPERATANLADEAEQVTVGEGSRADPTAPRVAELLDRWGEDQAREFEGLAVGELAELDAEYSTGNASYSPGAMPDSMASSGVVSLGLTRDVISVSRVVPARYRLAAMRVAEAMDVVTDLWTARVRAASDRCWSAAGWKRWQVQSEKLAAHGNRKERLVQCTTGAVGVQVFACGHGCGEQFGAVMGCNVRVCPRCAPKLRRANQAKVLAIMDAVDEQRRRRRCGPAKWRFVTLTVRSGPDFLPMRRFVCESWGKLINRKFWKDGVAGCLAFFETTHTAKGWHVHVHALVDAFIDRETLVRAWAEVTHGEGQPQGQHISLPTGTRKAIAHELAKYAAKDLGGATSPDPDDPWGVAGTPHRLAEFYMGSMRWRTLRTYGDAFRAAAFIEDSKIQASMLCECCGQADMAYDRTTWVRSTDLLAGTCRRSRPPP